MAVTKVRSIYVMKTADASGAVAKPRVSIERTASGALVLGVHCTGRSIGQARERAQAEFSALLTWARETQARETLRDEMELQKRREQYRQEKKA